MIILARAVGVPAVGDRLLAVATISVSLFFFFLLGSQLGLKIQQVPACKMEPQSGRIM